MQPMQRIKTRLAGGTPAGFTMVEVVIVLVVVGLLFPLFAFILGMYHDAYYLDDRVKMNSNAAQALWYMEDSIRMANGFLTEVPSRYEDPYGPHNVGRSGAEAWSYKGDSGTSRVLITRNYATTSNPLNTGRQPVFVDTPLFNCTTQMTYQPQLTYVSIYFVKDGTLYHRVAPDKTTALCAGSSQQQKISCPPYITSGRNSSCEANDEVLATNVSNFTVEYFRIAEDGGGSAVQLDPAYTSTNPAVLSTADFAIVTLSESTHGGAVTTTLKQRMTKVNQ